MHFTPILQTFMMSLNGGNSIRSGSYFGLVPLITSSYLFSLIQELQKYTRWPTSESISNDLLHESGKKTNSVKTQKTVNVTFLYLVRDLRKFSVS